MNRKRWILAAGLACSAIAVVVVAAVLLWRSMTPLQVVNLHSGDMVTLRSGMSIAMPAGSSGSLSRWRSPGDAAHAREAADSVLLHNALLSANGREVFIDSYAVVNAPAWTMGRVASASQDGTVQVRWAPPHPGLLNVWVATRVPGRLSGLVLVEAPSATSPGAAWKTASALWQRLSVRGIALPPAPK